MLQRSGNNAADNSASRCSDRDVGHETAEGIKTIKPCDTTLDELADDIEIGAKCGDPEKLKA
jgi:hypothetical protein